MSEGKHAKIKSENIFKGLNERKEPEYWIAMVEGALKSVNVEE